MDLGIAGRWALVGGASKGLGLGCARALAAEGVNVVMVARGAEALQGVLGGHVDALADSSSWAPHVEAGKLRLLATWGEQRTARFKDVPTLRELGYEQSVYTSPWGIAAPHGTPEAVVQRLRTAARMAAQDSKAREVIHNAGNQLVCIARKCHFQY